jgi:predicted DNA-binding protein
LLGWSWLFDEFTIVDQIILTWCNDDDITFLAQRSPSHNIILNRDHRKNVMENRDRYFTDKIEGNNCRRFGREDYFMIKAINLTESIEERLLAICQKMGCKENELIEEAILNYLEDFEDIQDANDRLSSRPENYLTLAEVEQELGLANRV